MANNANMLKGIVELLIIKIIDEQEDVYAFELSDLISEYSRGLINITHPTLYPTLYRLQERGYIATEEKIVANRRRRYYKLQDEGREYFDKIKGDYLTIREGLDNVLTYSKKEGSNKRNG
jgi:DNA-binding PadR family transcriptional regulator